MALSASAEADKILVGIDFGTTFSGVAWAYSGDPDAIEIVTNWESEFSHCSDVEKTPSRLCYDQYHNVSSWGYGIPAGSQSISWFKLLLLEDRDVPSDVAASVQFSEAKNSEKKLGKDPIEFVGDYLSKLWKHALESIERAVGKDLMKRCEIHAIITVPAIWPPYAHQRVRKAAERAGIKTTADGRTVSLGLISEPEAAALATIKDMAKRSNVEVGDTIVVCDAGGGTVARPPFAHDGGLCGGIFLDEEFLTAVKLKLGKKQGVSLDEARKAAFLNDAWEHGVKTQFQNQQRTWLIDVPTNAVAGLGKRPKALEMSRQDIYQVFEPIVQKITCLVEEQVAAIRSLKGKEAKYIVLVGGFGRNRYLFERLKGSANGNTTVLQSQGPKPWTAICRGAVIRALISHDLSSSLSVKVKARIARMSCGVEVQDTWVEGLYLQKDKVWSDDWQQHQAAKQMDWFLNMGDKLDSVKPVRKSFQRLLSQEHCSVEEDILVSYETRRSSRFDHTVHELCTIKWHTRNLTSSVPMWTNAKGKTFRKLDFEIEMTSHGGTVEFAVFYGSQKIGSQHVSVDFH